MIGLFVVATLSAGATEPVVSPDALAAHSTERDCWIAVEGGVYDITAFVEAHPGGPVLAEHCGTDATGPFRQRPGSGTEHSLAARVMLAEYRIGRLDAPPPPLEAWRTLDPMWARHGVTVPSATVVGHKQIHVGVAFHQQLGGVSKFTNGELELGWGFFNRADLVLSQSWWSSETSVSVKWAPLQQQGRRRTRSLQRGPTMPLSVAVQLSAGWRSAEAIEEDARPAYTGDLVVQRDFGPARLALTGSLGISNRVSPQLGALLDVKPHHTGGFFGELTVTRLGARTLPRFSGGLRAYTRAHVFSFYAGTSPALSPGEALSPVGGWGLGAHVARRFPLKIRP